MNASDLRTAMAAIAAKMKQERQYLIELDQRNGDGDLGISMDEGFNAASRAMNESAETDLGKLLICASKAFNEAAPSSLGTIMSLQMMGMARTLKGHASADAALLGEALKAGVEKVMDKAGSKPGEKTILDALVPAVDAICTHAGEGFDTALKTAADAAAKGSDSTANMPAVHGRAAYYGDKAIGLIDGGSIVGRMIFETLAQSRA